MCIYCIPSRNHLLALDYNFTMKAQVVKAQRNFTKTHTSSITTCNFHLNIDRLLTLKTPLESYSHQMLYSYEERWFCLTYPVKICLSFSSLDLLVLQGTYFFHWQHISTAAVSTLVQISKCYKTENTYMLDTITFIF